jgi:hypothetical protein
MSKVGTDNPIGSNKCPQRLTFGIDHVGLGALSSIRLGVVNYSILG